MKKILLAGLLLAGSLFAKEQTLLLGTRNITIKNNPILANKLQQTYKETKTDFDASASKFTHFLKSLSGYKITSKKQLAETEKYMLLASILNKREIDSATSYLNIEINPEKKLVKDKLYLYNLETNNKFKYLFKNTSKTKVYQELAKGTILLNAVKLCKKSKYNLSYYLIKNGFEYKEIMYTYTGKYNFLKKLYEIDVNKNTCQQINKNKNLWLKNNGFADFINFVSKKK